MQTATSRDVTASGTTGTIVQVSGPYKCNTHTDIVVIFKKGAKFTNCPMNKNHATTWSIVRAS